MKSVSQLEKIYLSQKSSETYLTHVWSCFESTTQTTVECSVFQPTVGSFRRKIKMSVLLDVMLTYGTWCWTAAGWGSTSPRVSCAPWTGHSGRGWTRAPSRTSPAPSTCTCGVKQRQEVEVEKCVFFHTNIHAVISTQVQRNKPEVTWKSI